MKNQAMLRKIHTSELFFEAHPAMCGWAIIAIWNGEHFMVEGGLRTPNTRLKYWKRNKQMVIDAIRKRNEPAEPTA